MSELAYRKLSDTEMSEQLAQSKDWSIEEGQLTKTFSFDTYKDGAVFASAVAWTADKLNHHPDLTLTYGKVKVAVNTHDVGGISPYDFELARRIDAL